MEIFALSKTVDNMHFFIRILFIRIIRLKSGKNINVRIIKALILREPVLSLQNVRYSYKIRGLSFEVGLKNIDSYRKKCVVYEHDKSLKVVCERDTIQDIYSYKVFA